MAFYSCASKRSTFRGVKYFEKQKVKSFRKVEEGIFAGEVEGKTEPVYSVMINLAHPKLSTCTCPHAEDRSVVCKHMIALYFQSVPGSIDEFWRDINQMEVHHELKEERWREQMLASITSMVNKLSAEEAKQMLIKGLYQQELNNRDLDEDDDWYEDAFDDWRMWDADGEC